ncbi:MAG: CinA family protein [Anaerolineae bacterium]
MERGSKRKAVSGQPSAVSQSYELAARVGALLKSRRLSLAVAESCTGGLLMHYLTNVPGSSRYFEGGVVAYSYGAKERVLGVSHETLYDHGAVSEPTALEMARGVRRTLGTDVGVAITGIAGPGGEMPGKPVGLVFIALSAPGVEQCEQYTWSGDRAGNKEQSALAALRLLLRYLEGEGDM